MASLAVAVLAMAAQRGHSAPREEDGQRTSLAGIERRLEAIEASQQAMMKTLDSILEELRIIKVRATR
jgi:hypothetical protein